jgi:pseudouridine-5'-phosphate glycosidase
MLKTRFHLNRLHQLNAKTYSSLSSSSDFNNLITISESVKDSIRNHSKPVIALESTIITHGLPYPTNLETAIQIEKIIEAQNCQPATIAFLDGKLKIGLTRDELQLIATESSLPNNNCVKISRRDLAHIYYKSNEIKNIIGGTTVSATMIAAHAANIPIFVTGGIGGVHRDFNESFDISADLQELSRTPVAVVSSGVKVYSINFNF